MAAASAEEHHLRDDKEHHHRDDKDFKGEAKIEKIYEKPVVISHQEEPIHKETYEG
jgi:hypothetical protein